MSEHDLAAGCWMTNVELQSTGRVGIDGTLAGHPPAAAFCLSISGRSVPVAEADVAWGRGRTELRSIFRIDVESGLTMTGSQLVALVLQLPDGEALATSLLVFPFLPGSMTEATGRHGIIVMDQPPLDYTPMRMRPAGGLTVEGWALGPQDRRGQFVRIYVDGTGVATTALDRARDDLRPLFPGRPDAMTAGYRVSLPASLLPAGEHVICAELVLEDGETGPQCGAAVIRPGDGAAGHPLCFRDFQPRRDLSGRARPSTAVLVRTHINDPKVLDLFQTLLQGEGEYDTFCIVDETSGTLDLEIRPDRLISASVQAMRLLGLSQQSSHLMWLCGDFCFYAALTALPPYDHYFMIEYDMHLMHDDPGFIADICRRLASDRAIDMVGLTTGPAGPEWDYYEAAARIFPRVHGMYYPLLALSRRAVSYLYFQRLAECSRQPSPADLIHCEPFTASALQQGGFVCLSFDELLPGTLDRDLLSNDIRNARVMGCIGAVPDGIKLVHPVFSPGEFRARLSLARTRGFIGAEEARRLIVERAELYATDMLRDLA